MANKKNPWRKYKHPFSWVSKRGTHKNKNISYKTVAAAWGQTFSVLRYNPSYTKWKFISATEKYPRSVKAAKHANPRAKKVKRI